MGACTAVGRCLYGDTAGLLSSLPQVLVTGTGIGDHGLGCRSGE